MAEIAWKEFHRIILFYLELTTSFNQRSCQQSRVEGQVDSVSGLRLLRRGTTEEVDNKDDISAYKNARKSQPEYKCGRLRVRIPLLYPAQKSEDEIKSRRAQTMWLVEDY